MERRRVVVTGMGVVSPFGVGVKTFWDNLVAGKSGIKVPTIIDVEKHPVKIAGEVSGYNEEDYFDPKEAKKLDRYSQFALIAAKEAIEDSKLDLTKEDPYRVGTIVSTAAGGFKTFEENHIRILERGVNKCSPFTIPKMIVNMASGNVSMKYGIKGICKSVISACATGTHSIGDAARSIQWGDADIMVAGGSEAVICDTGMGGFASARTLSKRNDEPEKASRPYDKDRDGFVNGEGAGVLVLEELEHAKARGAKIYAEIVGYGQTGDAYDLVAPDPEGKGAENSMKIAMNDAEIKPEDIDYINTHGTSTGLGDKAESWAIAHVFGDKEQNKNLCVSSTKSMHGHMLGATGAVEAVACIETIVNGIVPPTINLDNQDPEVANLDYVPHKSRKKDVTYALSNSFGFGGQNSTLVFKKY